MNRPYKVIIKRSSYEMLQVYAENELEAIDLARRNEGIVTFKADDKTEILAVKEGKEPTDE